ncbi:MAG: hypothetical protein KA067_03750 [Prevotella sp.]|jgi:uncharacterized protein YjhX (UPF0386 family)|nr:hypothetical protein [Prevotella sp.]
MGQEQKTSLVSFWPDGPVVDKTDATLDIMRCLKTKRLLANEPYRIRRSHVKAIQAGRFHH